MEYVELPPEAFPMKLVVMSMATGEKVWETVVKSPEETGVTEQVASKVREHGPLRIRVTYGYDGSDS